MATWNFLFQKELSPKSRNHFNDSRSSFVASTKEFIKSELISRLKAWQLEQAGTILQAKYGVVKDNAQKSIIADNDNNWTRLEKRPDIMTVQLPIAPVRKKPTGLGVLRPDAGDRELEGGDDQYD